VRGRRPAVAAGVLITLLVLAASPAPATTSTAAAAPVFTPPARVAQLVARMTLDEKLSFVRAQPDPEKLGSAGYVPGVPRLGIPPLRLSDGPAGVRVNHPATALPAPVALASSWDAALARDYGKAMARDGRALRQDVQLAPMTNIIRVPQGGRNFETYSEDPLLSANLAAAQVKGIQSQGLIATVKHFAANNQENNRMGVDVKVDEQSLREVELPAFQAAVDAGAGSVMCSYNGVNGQTGCGNQALLNDILKTRWGFQGWVMSDWGATHADSDLLAGLDQNMFTAGLQPSLPFGDVMKLGILAGTIPERALDTAVMRIVGQMERFGLLDGAATRRPSFDAAAGATVAQKVAEAGSVLLKNTAGALPLGSADTSIAVIGATAKRPKVTGNGSSGVTPVSAASPLDEIRDRAGSRADVRYAAGLDTAGTRLPLADTSILDADGDLPLAADGLALKLTSISVPAAGDYILTVDAPGSHGELSIDGKKVVDSTYGRLSADVHLSAGNHVVTILATALQGVPTTARFTWVVPKIVAAQRTEAVALARAVRTPVVFAYDDLAEGADRTTLSLPFGQDRLISAVAKANPRTVVVLNTGSSITMPWLTDVKAVLDTYYPGQNGAQATARLLFGDVNPSGKLTQTFPADIGTTPVAGDPERYPGVGNVVTYKEGLDVGYKWYDRTGSTPLFPFGHGLSYTSFRYDDLCVRTTSKQLAATFRLTNTGRRTGSEVAQVYLGPSPDVKQPQVVRKLAGYRKVSLRPGQTKQVTVTVDQRQRSSWDATAHRWVLGGGARSVQVGSSSADLPLRAVTGDRCS
jgi:beta-glucosidase